MTPQLNHIAAQHHIEDLHRVAEHERLVRTARSGSSAQRRRQGVSLGGRRRRVLSPEGS